MVAESTAVKTIQMTIDERLPKVVDKRARARKTTRSAFIRDALEAAIRRQRILEEPAAPVINPAGVKSGDKTAVPLRKYCGIHSYRLV
jgi:hypothetical protein